MSWDVFTAGSTAALWAYLWVLDRRVPLPVWFLGCCAALYASFAAVHMVTGTAPATMLVDGGITAWSAWLAWKRRRPRQRKPSKAAGIVRDLGHRLVVTHG